MKMRNRLVMSAGAASLALLLTACASPSAQEVLSDTAANLGRIDSGVLTMRMLTESSGQLAGRMGFELEGPFALPVGDETLPVAEFRYTQIAGPESAEATFISTGEEAFVEIGGQAYELPVEDLAEEPAAAPAAAAAGLGSIQLDRWIREPELSDGGEVGGADTWKITADLNAGAAIPDLMELSGSLGSTGMLSAFDGTGSDQLEQAVESSTIEVFTGKDDRLLRRLVMDVRLGLSHLEEELGGAALGLADLHLRFEVEVADIGRQVSVEAPTDVLPISELATAGVEQGD
jgi:hypothetical protein